MKITDIAKQAGVSPTTVSLVLNGKPNRISEATKKKILDIANQNNYIANPIAVSLVTKKTHIIGMVIPDIENIFFASLVKHIESILHSLGYMLMIVNSHESEEGDLRAINILLARGVDGLLIVPSNESLLDNQLESELIKLTVPYILVDRYLENSTISKVAYDNQIGMQLAIDYLISKNHNKIICIYGDDNRANQKSRINAFLNLCQKYRIDTEIFDGKYKVEGGYQVAEQVIKMNINAIIICNDMMTIGFIKYLYENAPNLIDKFDIVSYDNTIGDYFPWLNLSYIEQDTRLIADETCHLLLELIEERIAVREVILSPKISHPK